MTLAVKVLDYPITHHVTQRTSIEKAMAFSIDPVLHRYAKTYTLPMSVVCQHEREMKRYLAMCAVLEQRAGIYGLCGPVDDLWHIFIIFTRMYLDFCNTVAGRFLHHTPTEAANGDAYENYARTLRVYEDTFNEKPPAHIWPSLNRDMEASGSGGSGSCHQ